MKKIIYLLTILAIFQSCDTLRQPTSAASSNGKQVAYIKSEPTPAGLKGDKENQEPKSNSPSRTVTIISTTVDTVIKGLVGDKTTDNYTFLQARINHCPTRETLQFPSGNFYFDSTLMLVNKNIFLVGTGNTNFYFRSGITGIYISGNNGYMPGKITGINLFSLGANPLYTKKKGHGIEVHALYDLEDINIRNFGECGVYTTGTVTENTNASHNKYESVFVREIGGHAFYMHGGDANQIVVFRSASWDVGGHAVWDDSFLGCRFIGYMAHNSKQGHFRADNGNNATSFEGCYGEEDSPPSIFGGATLVTGGIVGWQVLKDSGGHYYFKDAPKQKYISGGYIITSPWARVITPH
jgi:hypothetical protein